MTFLPSLSVMERTFTLGAAGAIAVFAGAMLIGRLMPPENLAELPPLKPLVKSEHRLIVGVPEKLEAIFDGAGYELSSIRNRQKAVPRLYLREWPKTFDEMKRTARKKRLFARVVLPIVLYVNEQIRLQRAALLELIRKENAGQELSRREREWLKRLAAFYRTKPEKHDILRLRVAPIPPSLAIAQAAIETGWGTSRFARDGNAMFGQWTFNADLGLRPSKAEAGTRHAVKVYDRLVDSAWDYARNLNSNAAYSALRKARASGVRNGRGLAARLGRYSERGAAYVTLVRNVIAQNRLAALDQARLTPDRRTKTVGLK